MMARPSRAMANILVDARSVRAGCSRDRTAAPRLEADRPDPSPQRISLSRSEEAGREPGDAGDNDDADQKSEHVGPDIAHRDIGLTPADHASAIESDPERRREQPERHRKHGDHRILDLVNPQLLR